MNDISAINGIKITTDENGNQHFEVIEEPKKEVVDSRSWWQKFKDWLFDKDISPYIKIRDLSNPLEDKKTDLFDDGSGSATGIEAGIKISF